MRQAGLRKYGWFRVPERILIEDEFVAKEIFNGLIIHDCNRRFDWMGTEYLAEGDVFDEVPEGCEAPWYELRVDGTQIQFVRQKDACTNSERR